MLSILSPAKPSMWLTSLINIWCAVDDVIEGSSLEQRFLVYV